jgi:tryptophan-rich sensory protein
MNIIRLIISILIAQSAGAVGSLFTVRALPEWYASLRKPWFNPPGWIFGPVWGVLYTLMGIALFLIWRTGLKGRQEKLAVLIFAVQLALNALWSVIFFGARSIPAAMVEIILLWLAILATIISFAKISRMAAWLLSPYLLWVSFAAVLNFFLLIKN